MQTYQNVPSLATGHSEVEGRVQTPEFFAYRAAQHLVA